MNTLSEDLYRLTLRENLSMEGMTILEDNGKEKKDTLYILLTDTKTFFSKVSKRITGEPYNHISISYEKELDNIFSYAIKTIENGFKGGFQRETRSSLKGSKYSLYSVTLPFKVVSDIKSRIRELELNKNKTQYNHLALANIVFGKELFGKDKPETMICSEFVVSLFDEANVKLFKRKSIGLIRPYEVIRSKLLKFEGKGTL